MTNFFSVFVWSDIFYKQRAQVQDMLSPYFDVFEAAGKERVVFEGLDTVFKKHYEFCTY